MSTGASEAGVLRPCAPPHGSSGAERCTVWAETAERFSTSRVQSLRHDFHLHPLMTMAALAKLAARLEPTGQCRFIKPGSSQSSNFDHGSNDPAGRAIEEVFDRIEDPGSWIALYNVETDPEYRTFLDEVIGSARQLIELQEPGIFSVGGFIFISAPPSVTPFHIDRENNFWLQVRGRKTINVWERTDRRVVDAQSVDRFILNGSLGGVRLKPEFVERSHEFDVGPGGGVYFPSTSPHMTRSDPGWTRPGDGVSVSIGVVFYTAATRRRARAHVANLALRKLGLSPMHPGESDLRDRLKAPIGQAVISALEMFGDFKRKPGI